MGYIICKECGGYYELGPDESPSEFETCTCGGELEYVESLENLDKPSDKIICPNCGSKTQNNKFCKFCGKSLKSDNKPDNKESVEDKVRLNINKIITFWETQSKRNKIIAGIVVFLLLAGILYVFTLPTDYHVGTSSFRLPEPYAITGGYTADTTSETELYSSETITNIYITEFVKMDDWNEHKYYMYINPDTIDRWNGHSGYSAYTSKLYVQKDFKVNNTAVTVFEDQVFNINNYMFAKNGKYYLVEIHYQPDNKNDVTKILQTIVNTMQ